MRDLVPEWIKQDTYLCIKASGEQFRFDDLILSDPLTPWLNNGTKDNVASTLERS